MTHGYLEFKAINWGPSDKICLRSRNPTSSIHSSWNPIPLRPGVKLDLHLHRLLTKPSLHRRRITIKKKQRIDEQKKNLFLIGPYVELRGHQKLMEDCVWECGIAVASAQQETLEALCVLKQMSAVVCAVKAGVSWMRNWWISTLVPRTTYTSLCRSVFLGLVTRIITIWSPNTDAYQAAVTVEFALIDMIPKRQVATPKAIGQ